MENYWQLAELGSICYPETLKLFESYGWKQ